MQKIFFVHYSGRQVCSCTKITSKSESQNGKRLLNCQLIIFCKIFLTLSNRYNFYFISLEESENLKCFANLKLTIV